MCQAMPRRQAPPLSTTRALAALTAILWCCAVQAGSEDRITAAMPIPHPLEADLQALVTLAGAVGEQAQVQGDIAAKKRARAIECSHGYSPSWLASAREIQSQLSDTECFSRSDEALQRWARWRRVGILLRQPALRPVAANPPPLITAQWPILDIRVAAKAGVMLLSDRRNLELLDLADGRVLLSREGFTSGPPGRLSPNGRIFVVASRGRLCLIDSASGEELTCLTEVPSTDFFWLTAHTVLYSHPKDMTVHVVNLDTAEDQVETGLGRRVRNVAPLPGSNDEFLVFSMLSVLRLKVEHAPYGERLVVSQERALDPRLAVAFSGGLTTDGAHYLHAVDALYLTSPATLETIATSLRPYYVRDAAPLPDPDLVLLQGRVDGVASAARHEYVYSLSRKTFAPIDASQLQQTRVVALPHLNRVGLVSENRLSLAASVPVLAAMSQEQFLASLTDEQHSSQANQPPFISAQRHGNVTNLEVKGQLARSHDLGCMGLDAAKPIYTAADLYGASRACVEQGRYEESVPLFMLAGTYGRYDGARLADKTAAQGVTVLIMNFGAGLTQPQRDGFSAAVKRFTEPPVRASTCTAIRRLGPPTYFPTYLVLHGIRAFTSPTPLQDALDPSFDANATWETLLRDGLQCSTAGGSHD